MRKEILQSMRGEEISITIFKTEFVFISFSSFGITKVSSSTQALAPALQNQRSILSFGNY